MTFSPAIRPYGLYFFLYFAATGVFMPYFGAWLGQMAVESWLVGLLLACLRLSNLTAPMLWSPWAMGAAEPRRWLAGGTLVAAVGLLGLGLAAYLGWTIGWIIAVLWFGMFFSAVLPQADAMTLRQLGDDQRDQYGPVRMWGSLGYALITIPAGALILNHHPAWFIVLGAFFMAAASFKAWRLPTLPQVEQGFEKLKKNRAWWKERLGRPFVLWTLILGLLLNVAFTAYYLYFAASMAGWGYDGLTIGLLVSLAVVVEIWAFLRMPTLLQRWTPQDLAHLCVLLTIGRWGVMVFLNEDLGWIVIAQLTHAFGFAAFHAATAKIMADAFPKEETGEAMALLNTVTFGLGGTVGAVMMGWLWATSGASAVFYSALVVTVLAWMVGLWRPKTRKPVDLPPYPSHVDG